MVGVVPVGWLLGIANGVWFELPTDHQSFYGRTDGGFEFSASNRSIYSSKQELIVGERCVSAAGFSKLEMCYIFNCRQIVNRSMLNGW